jgi:hypothetical protein
VLATGKYDKGITQLWLPIKEKTTIPYDQFCHSYAPENGLDLSTKISYSFNTENDDTHYRSGDYFGDYSIGYKLSDHVKVAIEGYAFKQTKSDRQHGDNIGMRGQVWLLVLLYNIKIKLVGRSKIFNRDSS